MDDKNIQQSTSSEKSEDTQNQGTQEAIEWGQNHQERIIDKPYKSESKRHLCKRGQSCQRTIEES